MATLIVDFHCMCLFVPDGNVVHVLLPRMTGSGDDPGEVVCCTEDGEPINGDHLHAERHAESGDGHGPPHGQSHTPTRHLARVRNAKFPDQKLGKAIEDVILKVGNGTDAANTAVNGGPEKQPRLPDLSDVSGCFVMRKLLAEPLPNELIARFTLGAGAVVSRHSDPYVWNWNGESGIQLANTVTWIVPDCPDQLDWQWGASNQRPIQSVSRDLEPLVQDVYRISIHHETKKTLCGGTIDIREMLHHFAAFYPLLGMDKPTPAEKPELFPMLAKKRKDDGLGASVLCRSAMARLASVES